MMDVSNVKSKKERGLRHLPECFLRHSDGNF